MPKAPDSQPRLRATRALSGPAREASAELAESLAVESFPDPEDPCEVAPVELRQTLIPTASKTDLLFACTWPWMKRFRPLSVDPSALFGSAYHEVLEGALKNHAPAIGDVAKKWGVETDELQARVESSMPILYRWLMGDNLWGLNFYKAGLLTEISAAYNVEDDTARYCDPPSPEGHEYRDRRRGEIPGTTDVTSFTGDTLLVLDHKSGWNVAMSWQPRTPAESGQLRTLGLTLGRLHPSVKRIIVAFFHAPAEGEARVMADELSPRDIDTHARMLKVAFRNIGNGWMRPGLWCDHCNGASECPTKQPNLIELRRGGGPLTREKVGAIHERLSEYDHLRDKLRDEMRGWVRMNGPGIRPSDGKSVQLVPRETSNLSQQSILRALGPIKGAKEIARLEKLGCIEHTTREELRAVRE